MHNLMDDKLRISNKVLVVNRQRFYFCSCDFLLGGFQDFTQLKGGAAYRVVTNLLIGFEFAVAVGASPP